MNFYHRPHRLLLDAEPIGGVVPPRDGGRSQNGGASFDTNMVIILSALLCALICALGINSIVRLILRCARRVSSDGATAPTPPRLCGKGIKKGVLRRLPVAVYGSDSAVGFTDCPICLSEFLDGEKIRILPKCHHCFHVRCVDVWLASHSTCPTCRRSLAEEQPEESGGGGGGGEAVVEMAGRQVWNASGGHGDVPAAEEVG